MNTFVAVCLGVITLELGIVVAFLVVTLRSVQQTAQAVEVLAYRIDEQVDHLGGALRSRWMRTLQAVASFAGGFWGGRRRT